MHVEPDYPGFNYVDLHITQAWFPVASVVWCLAIVLQAHSTLCLTSYMPHKVAGARPETAPPHGTLLASFVSAALSAPERRPEVPSFWV